MPTQPKIITVTMNTAIDRVIEVPGFEVGAHLRGKRVARYAGGKAINVSRALARLGRNSIATGFVGQDDSDLFEQLLAEIGPGRAVSQLLSVQGATRENITIVDPENRTDTHVREVGFELTDPDLGRLSSKVGLLGREGSVILFSGSLPPGMTPGHVRLMVDAAQRQGARVALDLNGDDLRDVLGDDAKADAPARDGDDAQPPWLLAKPNRDEMAELFGVDGEPDDDQTIDLARRLAARFRWVVVTLGAEGAWLVSRDGVWRGRLQLDPQDVVNTVGCGDCMVAGLLDAHARGAEPTEMLSRGLATAAANALSAGVAQFDRRQVQRLQDRAQVEPFERA